MRSFQILLVLCFIPAIIHGQDRTKRVKDFNGDGFKDTLVYYYDGGSGFGGMYYELTNGKTTEKFELNTWACFCRSSVFPLIPQPLKKKENAAFLDTLKKLILPIKLSAPDPSLEWVINGKLSAVTLNNHVYFDKVFSSPLNWIGEERQFPDLYYLEFKGEKLKSLHFTDGETPEWKNMTTPEGWLIYNNYYYGIKRDKALLAVDSAPGINVYKTSHAVILKKNNKHAWAFVTDHDLTDSPEKLRWASIKKIKLIDNFLFIQQALPTASGTNLFVINIETGKVGRLKSSLSSEDDFQIDNGKLIFEMDNKKIAVELEKIFAELNRLHTH